MHMKVSRAAPFRALLVSAATAQERRLQAAAPGNGRDLGMHSVAAWTESMPKQRREGEANGPRGQRPPGASRTGPPVRRSFSEGGSWTEFVRLAHRAVVAFVGAGIINRAEPRACGHSREPICLDSEPDAERDAGSASNAAGNGG